VRRADWLLLLAFCLSHGCACALGGWLGALATADGWPRAQTVTVALMLGFVCAMWGAGCLGRKEV
jgi:hypothetical protein